MLDSIINNTITTDTYLYTLLASLVCGVIIAFTASLKAQVSKGFMISLVILPIIVNTVIIMVNGSIGTGIAVMGAFSLVRFRSIPGNAKDISMIFLTMAAGLTCSTGYIWVALLFTIFVCIVVAAFVVASKENTCMSLRITIPETISYSDAFEEILNKYCHSHRLVKVKTTNMGSLYKLFYEIQLIDVNNMQRFIDELRCRNGNLEISLSEITNNMEAL